MRLRNLVAWCSAPFTHNLPRRAWCFLRNVQSTHFVRGRSAQRVGAGQLLPVEEEVLRGIHYQITEAQGKLVRVTQGAVLDVAVDLRRSSPTFGKSVAVELNAENGNMLWIPPGFGHAFLALEDQTGFAYKSQTITLAR